MPASTRCWTRDSKGILIEDDTSTVIESLSSFRVRGDRMGVKVSLSNLWLSLNLTRGSRAEEFLRYQNWGITSVADYLFILKWPWQSARNVTTQKGNSYLKGNNDKECGRVGWLTRNKSGAWDSNTKGLRVHGKNIMTKHNRTIEREIGA